MVVNNEAIQRLKDLGMSEYEARAYVELLRNNPVSPYELAKNSGIPSSKIYEVLNRLKDRKAVIFLEEKGKQRCAPLEPEELLALQRKQMEQTLDGLGELLKEESGPSKISPIWNLNHKEDWETRLPVIIGSSKKELILSAWYEDLVPLENLLRKQAATGLHISIVIFGTKKFDFCQCFLHPIRETLEEEQGGRSFSLVSDRQRCILATLNKSGSVEGAWSSNRGFVELAREYIKHDIYLTKIVERMDPELQAWFGENYYLLRDIYSDRDLQAVKE